MNHMNHGSRDDSPWMCLLVMSSRTVNVCSRLGVSSVISKSLLIPGFFWNIVYKENNVLWN